MNTPHRSFRPSLLTLLALLAAGPAFAAPRLAPPNIVLIYADDLGYGDVSCYGATAVQTPHIDRLAREGLRFTDAHASAATCTPSRYAMLTGEYAWRKKGTGVLPGNAPLIIEPGRTTLPSLLRRAGYRTGVIGKWHLGLGPAGGPDWNSEIKPGPLEIGFDDSFLMAATADRVPCVYVQNHRVVGLDPRDPLQVVYGKPIPGQPTGKTHPELLRLHPSHGHDMAIVNGVSRIGHAAGGRAALWKDEDMADEFTRRAVTFIEKNRGGPFFLYFALHDPHVPRLPHPRFVGKTAMGPRGDAIVQADWCVGEILNALDRLNLTRDTLVIFTSDNGPVVDDGYKDDAVAKLGGHRPAGPWRGGKYSAFEGGTRVPFVVRWPARVRPGVTDALVCQIDFPRTFAALTGQKLVAGDAPDSADVLKALLGRSRHGRSQLVEQAGVLALRRNNWKYIEPGKGPKRLVLTNTESGQDPGGLLYRLDRDPGETSDLSARYPKLKAQMAAELARIKGAGRPPDDGAAASNESDAKTPNADGSAPKSPVPPNN